MSLGDHYVVELENKLDKLEEAFTLAEELADRGEFFAAYTVLSGMVKGTIRGETE